MLVVIEPSQPLLGAYVDSTLAAESPSRRFSIGIAFRNISSKPSMSVTSCCFTCFSFSQSASQRVASLAPLRGG